MLELTWCFSGQSSTPFIYSINRVYQRNRKHIIQVPESWDSYTSSAIPVLEHAGSSDQSEMDVDSPVPNVNILQHCDATLDQTPTSLTSTLLHTMIPEKGSVLHDLVGQLIV